MPLLLVILDGAADRKSGTSKSTPLQSASMPNLSRISSESAKGMMNPIGPGIAPESDAAVFSILGYDISAYTGRGPLEAFGAGLKVTDNSVAFRCNFATIDGRRNILDRRAGRIETDEAKALEREIKKINLGMPGVSFSFKSTVGHRAACVFYSRKALSSNVSNADIGYVRRGNISVAQEQRGRKLPKVAPLDRSAEAKYAAAIANSFIDLAISRLESSRVNASREKSGMKKANALLLRDAGKGLPLVKSFSSKTGMESAFIAEMPVEAGIAKVLGMRPIKLKQYADRKRRYAAMARLVLKNIRKYGFIYVHIKGPDEPGHDGNWELKKQILEEIDSGFFSKISAISADICVTCDHATPCSLKSHSSDPVPVMARIRGQAADSMGFDEEIGSRGSMGVFNGTELIKKLIKRREDAGKIN